MTIAGKRSHIRLAIAVVTILLVILAAKILFFSGDEEVDAAAATQKARDVFDRGRAKWQAGNTAGAIADWIPVLDMANVPAEVKEWAKNALRKARTNSENRGATSE
jgi:hypothetical protein